MFKNILFIIIAMILGSSSIAANNKFKVRGDTLFYSTEEQFISEKGIKYEDISMFRKLLSENPMVNKIELFSYGGSITAGLEISKIVRDFNVTTIVAKECSSSCISIFLAGKNRDESYTQELIWCNFKLPQSVWGLYFPSLSQVKPLFYDGFVVCLIGGGQHMGHQSPHYLELEGKT